MEVITTKNYVFTANTYDILQRLKADLTTHGIDLIASLKLSGEDVMVPCPWHKGGHERKPSCGVSQTGVVHCFACGKVSDLPSMVAYCLTGDEGNYNYGEQWLARNFLATQAPGQRVLPPLVDPKPAEQFRPEDLSKFRYYHPYMFKRKLTKDVINMFDIGYDKRTNSITFPVYDLQHRLVFVGRRNVNRHWFNYPAGVDKPVYGLEKVDPVADREVIVCESMFNALTCYVYGKKGVALLGTGSAYQYDILRRFPIREYVLAFDGDDAGRHGCERFARNVPGKVLERMVLPDGKDINDLTKAQFDDIFANKQVVV